MGCWEEILTSKKVSVRMLTDLLLSASAPTSGTFFLGNERFWICTAVALWASCRSQSTEECLNSQRTMGHLSALDQCALLQGKSWNNKPLLFKDFIIILMLFFNKAAATGFSCVKKSQKLEALLPPNVQHSTFWILVLTNTSISLKMTSGIPGRNTERGYGLEISA